MIGFPHFKQASFKKCNLLKQSLHIEYVLVSFIGLSQIMHEIFLGYIKSSIDRMEEKLDKQENNYQMLLTRVIKVEEAYNILNEKIEIYISGANGK